MDRETAERYRRDVDTMVSVLFEVRERLNIMERGLRENVEARVEVIETSLTLGTVIQKLRGMKLAIHED